MKPKLATAILIVLLVAWTLFVCTLYGQERARPWVRSTARDHNCVQDDRYGENGVDVGGVTGMAGGDKRLNIAPDYDSVAYSTYTFGEETGVMESGALNRSRYLILIPSTPTAKAIIHLHATSKDIYHEWADNWTGYWFTGSDDFVEEGLSKGYYQVCLTGWVGGHATHYFAQRVYDMTLYLKAEYGITDFVLSGGSYGAVASLYCADIWPEAFTGMIIKDPIGTSIRMDLPWTSLLQYEDMATDNLSQNGWKYDPRDGLAFDELFRIYYDGSTNPFDWSMAEQMLDSTVPAIIISAACDVRQRYDTWFRYLDGQLVSPYVFDHYAIEGADHGGPEDNYDLSVAAAGGSLIDRLEYLQGKLVGYIAQETSDPGDYDDLDGFLYPSIDTTASNTYAHEVSRIGHGSGCGTFDSMLVGEFDADDDQEVIYGSVGGGVFMLQEGASAVADFTVEDPAGNGTSWIGDQDLGYGVHALAYDTDTDVLFAGTMEGKLYSMSATSGALLATSTATYGRDIQHMVITSDLDSNSKNEVWFRTWDFYDNGGPAKIWCVEYDTVADTFATKSSTIVDPWCGNFVIQDIDADAYVELLTPLADGRVVVYELRGSSLRPQLQHNTSAKGDWFTPSGTEEVPFCPYLIRADDEYLYVMTLDTNYWNTEFPYAQQSVWKKMFYVYSLTTFAQLDVEAIEDVQLTFDVHEDGAGDKWLVTCEPGPVVRAIGSTGLIGDPTADIAEWEVGGDFELREINSVRTLDLDADSVREIITIDQGGLLNVFTCTWGEAITDGGFTRNLSRCYGMLERASGALMLKKSEGHRYQINPDTMAYITATAYENSGFWGPLRTGFVEPINGSFYAIRGRAIIADFGVSGIGTEMIAIGETTIGAYSRGVAMEHPTTTWAGQTGNRTWATEWNTAANPECQAGGALKAVDVDLDGDLDLLVSTLSGDLHCYDKTTDGGTEEAAMWTLDADLGWKVVGMDAAIFSGDTYPTIVLGGMIAEGDYGYVHIVTWDGTAYVLSETINLGTNIYGIKIDDLDGDGAQEIIIGSGDGHLYIYDEDWNQLWRSASTGGFMGAYGSIITKDADSQGDKEIYVGNCDFFIKYALLGD